MRHASYVVFETVLGPCGIAWQEPEYPRGRPDVILFQLPEATREMTESRIVQKTGANKSKVLPSQIGDVVERVRKHLQGEPQDFRDVSLSLNGTAPFSRRVYESTREIPAGQTLTYGELAQAIGQAGASRAVGQALGKNPVPIIVPCHRVLAAGGKAGGFSAHGGLATKTRLLAIEGATFGAPATIKSARDLRRAAKILSARDPRLASCLAKRVKLDLKREQSPYATLFEAIVHQQLSPKAALTILSRLKALYGGSAIPEPTQLLDTPANELREAGLSNSKAKAVKDLAAKTIDGTVPSADRIVSLSDEEIIQRLSSVYGIGPWTVEMMLIFNLGRMDVLPVDDYALRKSVAQVLETDEIPSPKQLISIGELWRPYRTVAALYLWNSITPEQS